MGLGGMIAMERCFGLPVGYSDHTDQPAMGVLAVAAGACVVEKHLTYDRMASDPDCAASCDPNQFADYVHKIRQAAAMLDPLDKRLRDVEVQVRQLCRQSICARARLGGWTRFD